MSDKSKYKPLDKNESSVDFVARRIKDSTNCSSEDAHKAAVKARQELDKRQANK